ncbi:MAG: hypothetical protein LJE68_10980 [Rhodobacter sp.]|nr:hypothetical protein [Rhodobacter sp.]
MLKFTHSLAYLALSGAHAGACLGIDDTAVKLATAALYLLLAVEAWRGNSP